MSRTGTHLSLLATVTLIGLYAPCPASAALVTWEFAATVRESKPNPGELPPDAERLFIGQIVRGTFSFSTEVPRSGGNGTTTAAYAGAMTELKLSILYAAPGIPGESALLFDLDPNGSGKGDGNRIWVNNTNTRDTLSYELPLRIPNQSYSTLGLLQLVLLGPELMSELGYLEQPPELRALSPYGTVPLSMRFPGSGLIFAGRDGFVGAELTMLRVVPEPGALALLLLVGLGLGLRQRSRTLARGSDSGGRSLAP